MVSTLAFVVSGLLIGAAFGYVLQRGRFCVNSAFREVLFQDYTMLRAYLLAVAVTMIGANLIEDMGWLGHVEQGTFVAGTLYRQAFVPWANIVGGYIFGMGIVLAGGCGSGILYRVGEGNLAYVFAVFGFFFGIAITKFGFLKPVYDALVNAQVVWVGPAQDIVPTLDNVIGVNKWIVIAVVAVPILYFVLQGKPFEKAKKGFSWSLAGFLAGLVAVAAFWGSEYFTGRARGLSFTGPVREFFLAVFFGDSKAPEAESMTLLGITISWSALYVLAVPIGAYISGKFLKEVKMKVPPADELIKVLLGGFVMGVGAQIGGGCNIGHSLTGVSTLAVSSWVANLFIILGNWTMVYFLLIRPMKDLDV
ncbi:MAG TPA: YeeE/YedE family protein [Nitrospirota bacterium]|nr:YeeE/YedE family protein [Nitrospirota bacterium]